MPALEARELPSRGRAAMGFDDAITEAWAEGFNVGALIILILLVVCNYRRRVLLHKLILLEMILSIWHATFIFVPDPAYDWYLSSTALLLFISYQVHNLVSYFKITNMLPRWGRLTFLITLGLVQPFWILEAYDNYAYFTGTSTLNEYTRPWEPLAREPWWVFTTCWLLYKIKSSYQLTFTQLLKLSPRFGVMIFSMFVSIAFVIVDIVVTVHHTYATEGVNPFWRVSFVFKAAADTIFLDDFKSVLDKIIARRTGGLMADGPHLQGETLSSPVMHKAPDAHKASDQPLDQWDLELQQVEKQS